MRMKIYTSIIVIFIAVLYAIPSSGQGIGINTGGPPDANSMLEVASTNKGILIPRIDYNNRPSSGVTTGMLIFVTANGPLGNNAFYYYNGSAWVRFYGSSDNPQLALSSDILSITPGNSVNLSNVFPVAGFIQCGNNYYNPLTNNNNCGACGNICSGGTSCINGTCQ